MKYTKKYMIKPGTDVKLNNWDPNDTSDFEDKNAVNILTEQNIERLSEKQYLLYAESKRAILIILQAMDAGGKDGTIRRVLGPLNPQGVQVTSFKKPTAEELGHDYLWRIHRATPQKGMIGVFNRSHYEDVLIVRVHNLVPQAVWKKRYDQINEFEKMLAANGVHILKFYLHISKDEQMERLQERLDDSGKHWKVNPQDFEERKLWKKYQTAYEAMLGKCSKTNAPWFVIPANKKWYRNYVLSQILLETMEKLDMQFPPPECDIAQLKKMVKK